MTDNTTELLVVDSPEFNISRKDLVITNRDNVSLVEEVSVVFIGFFTSQLVFVPHFIFVIELP